MNANKPARRERTNGTAAPDAPRVRKQRAAGGDFNAELSALADKHRKRSSKLRNEVAKLESKLADKRAALDAADEPLRKIERVLADRPELPGLPDTDAADVDEEAAMRAIAARPDAEGTPAEVSL